MIIALQHHASGTEDDVTNVMKEVRELLRITHGTPDSLLKPIEILGKLIAELLHLSELESIDNSGADSEDPDLAKYSADKQMILHAMDAIQRAYNAISARFGTPLTAHRPV